MNFRIAIGTCSCKGSSRDPIQQVACGAVQASREAWRARLPADLGAVPLEQLEPVVVEGTRMTLGTYKLPLDTGQTVVAFQALVHTWSRPTYLSLGAVGRLYAEGLLVSPEGDVIDAPDDIMWQFR